MKWALILGMLAAAASAQTVQVYSEFARLSESGAVISPAEPREILSPSVPRNAFSTFQIAIEAPPGTKYSVFLGQNPLDAVKAKLYRRNGDKLEPVGLPYEGVSSQVFWLDVWVDSAAPVRRVKVEPQVFIDDDWVSYPMEVRVSDIVMPNRPASSAGIASPFEMATAFLCGGEARPIGSRVVIGAELQFRNAQQDLALLAQSSPAQREEARKAVGGCGAQVSSATRADPELYLRLRDLFFTPAWQKMR
jgi:hypothetical protein